MTHATGVSPRGRVEEQKEGGLEYEKKRGFTLRWVKLCEKLFRLQQVQLS